MNPQSLTKRRSCQKGFTLIETLIAVVVMGIAVGALLLVLTSVVDQTVLPEIHNVGSHLLEREFERVTSQRFAAVVNEPSTAFPGSFSDYSWQVAVSPVPAALASDPGMSQYKQVLVTVTHASGGAVSLSTVVTNN